MFRSAILLLLILFSTVQAQYYRSSYSSSYYRPSYSYTPSYYTAPETYSKPSYQYEWSEAGWARGRWYPAGYYYWDGHCYYLKGYGSFAGYDRSPTATKPPEPAPAPKETTTGSLSPAEIATLKELLKKLN
jgi:hypothetical protein